MNLGQINMRVARLAERVRRYRKTGMKQMSVSVQDMEMMLGLVDKDNMPPDEHPNPLVRHYVQHLKMREADAVRAAKVLLAGLENREPAPE